MSAVEKLFVQIFEKKKAITEQVKRQTELFDQRLASKLLIDEIAPPPWLWNPSNHAHTSDPRELNKEELISGLLFPRQQPAIQHTNSFCSLYNKPVAIPDNGVVPCTLFAEGCASKKDIESQHGQPVSPTCPINNDGCASSGGPELEASVISPEDQRDVRTSGIYQDMSQSLVKIQRSKSRQRALEIRNSIKSAKSRLYMDTGTGVHTTGSGIASLQHDCVNEMESAKPIEINNGCCAMEEVKVGDELEAVKPVQINNESCAVEEVRGGNELESVKPVQISNESCAVEEVRGGNELESVKALQISNESCAVEEVRVDNELKSVTPVGINNSSSVVEEVKVDASHSKERGSNIYSGRITRSRISRQQSSSMNEFRKQGSSSSKAKEDGDTEEDSMSAHQSDALLESFKPSEVANQVSMVKNVKIGLHGSKEKESNGYHGRITRSKGYCRQSDCVNKPSFLGGSCNTVKDDGGILAKSIGELTRPSLLISWNEGGTDLQNVQGSQVTSGSPLLGNTDTGIRESEEKSSEDFIEVVPKAVNSCVSDKRVRQSRCATSEKIKTAQVTQISEERSLPNHEDRELSAVNEELLGKQLVDYAEGDARSEGDDLPIAFVSRVSNLPCAYTNDIVVMERCAAMTPETELPSDAPVQAPAVCSESTSDHVNLRVGSEVLASRSPSDIMFVKPQVLKFNKLEDHSLNETSSSVSGNKLRGISSEVIPLVENHVYLSHEEEVCIGSSEVHEKTAEVSKTSDLICLSSEKEISEVYKVAESDSLLENDKLTEQKCLTALDVASENSYACVFKPVDLNSSNVNVGSRIDSSGKSNEELAAAKMLKSVSETGKVGTDTCSDLKLPANAVLDESDVNSMQQNLSSDISQIQNVDSYLMGSRTSDDMHVGSSNSSEHQMGKKHVQQRSFGFGVEGSWPQHKRRKIESQLTSAQSALPFFRVMPPQSIQGNHTINNFNSIEDNLKDVLTFQQASISCDEDFGQPNVNKILAGGVPQNVKEVSEPSPNLQAEQGELSIGERDSDANAATSIHDRLLVPKCSKLGTMDCHDADKVAVVDPSTDIFDTSEQCFLEDNLDLLHYNSMLELKKTEHFTCTDIPPTELRNSHFGGNVKMSGYSVGSPRYESMDFMDADPTMPVLEGFVLPTDSEKSSLSGDVIQLEQIDLPDLERASLLEQLCRSASMSTPLCHFPTTYKWQGTPNLNQSVPNGLLECTDLQSTLSICDHTSTLSEAGYRSLQEESEHRKSFSDCQPFSVYSAWDVKKPFASPVGKHWDRITSYSSSSEKKRSLIPDLPCINEENEDTEEVADKFQGVESDLMPVSAKREPLADITQDPNLAASVSEAEIFDPRGSVASISSQISFTGTHKGKEKSSKRRYTNKAKENNRISQVASGVKSIRASLRNRLSKQKLSGKPSMREGGPSFTATECKRNNIVSNMTSFIPLVQQQQAAAVCTGKRDVKVRALEAAEAAKRLAEKKENERKMKKEALKLERARLEQENMRQLEIEKKRKEEERKQKEANMAAKKRQREEEERKEKEKKRKRVEEAWKQQRGPEKLLPGKEVKKMKCQAPKDERARDGKKANGKVGTDRNMEERGDDNLERLSKDETRTMASSTSAIKTHILHEDYANSSVCGDNTKVTSTSPNRTGSNLVIGLSHEQSYDMSPYKCSDDEEEDEEEEEDEKPNNKFIPSWSSKNLLELAVSSQRRADFHLFFPRDTFCIDEVVPRLK